MYVGYVNRRERGIEGGMRVCYVKGRDREGQCGLICV